MDPKDLSVIILAAGKGTRMKSSKPKVLHQIFGKPMLYHILNTCLKITPKNIFTVIGYKASLVEEFLKKSFPAVIPVLQQEQLGTAHAVKAAKKYRKKMGEDIIVLAGDCPLLTGKTLKKLIENKKKTGSAATLISATIPNPEGYGRIIKDSSGHVKEIIEEADADSSQKAINEVNTSVYCFSRDDLFESIDEIGSDNAQNEYYLTDIIKKLTQKGKIVSVFRATDYGEVFGINDRLQLSKVERLMIKRRNQKLMKEGVTIRDPGNCFIDPEAEIENDVTIEPYCFINGRTVIKKNCVIGPFCQITDTVVGKGTKINASVIIGSEIGKNNNIGPYSYIRPDTVTGDKVKIGGFCEVKKSMVGRGSKVPHLSYVGDTEIGAGVNVGASCVTVNYDGYSKSKTIIEDGVFIGSDTMLIAPVKIGKGAIVAAGSVITEDVPGNSLAIERGEQKNIKDGATRYRRKKEIEKRGDNK
ncbi:MAG: bifunctional UDP-N-acetylglucosamine diphosphorylase/glucosamine-1-phosphate N-acetyltransferase GlmU [Candidatus Humimicrobiaceae bacterium]